jgi:hypothetical protein
MKKGLTMVCTGLLLILAGCASFTGPSSTTSYGIFGQSTSIKYISYEDLVAETDKKAETGLWSQERKQKGLDEIPLGGYIRLDVVRLSIGAADTENFEIIVFKDGKELYRAVGRHSIPHHSVSGGHTTWWNIDMFPLAAKIEKPFDVYIIDAVENKRLDFKIE